MPEYQGVDVEHPSIKRAIINMLKNGAPDHQIRKVVGMPQEVIDRYKNEIKK